MFEWMLPLVRPATSALTGAKSLFDKIRGKQPTADFRPTGSGVVLHIANVREETIIIERIEAVPRLLTFSAGKEIRDLVAAMVGENGIAALSAAETTEFDVIVIDPFQTTAPDEKIKVTAHWRSATRSRLFSAGKISKTISVRDVEDLRRESERRRARPLFTSV